MKFQLKLKAAERQATVPNSTSFHVHTPRNGEASHVQRNPANKKATLATVSQELVPRLRDGHNSRLGKFIRRSNEAFPSFFRRPKAD